MRFVLRGDQVADVAGELILRPATAGQNRAVSAEADAGRQRQLGQQSAGQRDAQRPRLHERLAGYVVVGHQVQVVGDPPGPAQPGPHRVLARPW
jgi:hypothetical protein